MGPDHIKNQSQSSLVTAFVENKDGNSDSKIEINHVYTNDCISYLDILFCLVEHVHVQIVANVASFIRNLEQKQNLDTFVFFRYDKGVRDIASSSVIFLWDLKFTQLCKSVYIKFMNINKTFFIF